MAAPQTLLAIIVPWAGISDLAPALAALTGLNMEILRRHPLPSIYGCGVRYQREERLADGTTREQWLTAPVIHMRHAGDCEDLASWRAAELRLQGIEATAIAKRSSLGYHIVVRYPDGTIEDPSRKLGM
jgi:hypothetical protein